MPCGLANHHHVYRPWRLPRRRHGPDFVSGCLEQRSSGEHTSVSFGRRGTERDRENNLRYPFIKDRMVRLLWVLFIPHQQLETHRRRHSRKRYVWENWSIWAWRGNYGW